ncbi:diacylglycerol/lipid kinase family protein [Limobrevibacterium gyesilva]|uniref:Diacylglycerol kinase family protein n=1 Tax=Limobrevibacterium gyesilva TaxID=2991712 RepID=A0AA41YI48_9PROT|nr:diacylglycerol kinase family protein [Limobrevibacterium gyesilva]MCW3473349.1 diacylglycerol kinase family protein [Limobrevibacterium gyesilva]
MTIVFNPAAGRRRAQLLWHVLDVMAANGVGFEIEETRRPGHATEIARQAARAGITLVVAAGGDGTIAEVANGLSGSPCRLGIIPLGTANVLAHELGLPFAPRAVAASLAFGRTRAVWPGIACGESGTRLFVQMLGAGFDAQVVHGLSKRLKRTIGRGAYVAQTLRELARYGFPPIRLRLDGAETETGSVIVTKGHLYAGCYTLAPGATPTDKGFTVALFDRGGPMAALLYGAALPLNLLPRMSGLRLLRADRIDILSSQVPAQADGDPAGETPLSISDAPAPMNVVVG